MSATLSTPKTTSGGEIIRELVNASDGQGLHFDGVAGNIDIASPPDLGTKFSMEFIVQADSFGSANSWLIDFGNGGRFVFGSDSSTSYNLGIYDNASWKSLGVKVLDDLKVHHLTLTVDGTSAILYDNANQVGTATISGGHAIDSCADAKISGAYTGGSNEFTGTLLRTRFWNKTLSSTEVTATYENATVPFADQYGSQTNKITAAVDKNWGTNAADATAFNAAYDWVSYYTTAISVTSNVLTFSTAANERGVYIPSVSLSSGKRYRVTIATGTITGTTYSAFTYKSGVGFTNVGALAASSTNVIEFTVTGGSDGNFHILSDNATAGTIQLNAASVSTELVAAGCVADYDLAFANQKQSLVVEDRSGSSATGVNATGMMSASGVTQVTPIEQLNTKSLSVGTVAATPADGQIIVGNGLRVNAGTIQLDDVAESIDFVQSGAINFDSNNDQPGRTLTIGSGRAGGASGGTTNLVLTEDGKVGVGVSPTYAFEVVTGAASAVFEYADHTTGTQTIKVEPSATKAGGTSKIYSSYAGTGASVGKLALGVYGATDALTLDSAGNVTVGSASQSLANLNISAAGGIGGGLLINRNATGFVTSGQYLGSIGFKGTDSANSNAAADAAIVAKASETHSGSTAGTNLEFYTKPSGTGPGSSPSARLTIDSAGNVSVGHAHTPIALMDVRKNAAGDILYIGGSDEATIGQRGLKFTCADSGVYKGAIWKIDATAGAGEIKLATGGTERLSISSAGAVTMPTTPAFSAQPSVNQNNIPINTETDIVFGTEIFDQGGNFASNTFTAPVAGRYQLNLIVAAIDIDSAADFYQFSIVTSNRSYNYTFDPDFGQDPNYWEGGPSILADMDANDTAVVKIYQSSGTAQTDIEKSRTYFNGFLAC